MALTTHILDLAEGIPAVDVRVDLFILKETSAEKELLKTSVTNHDGRLDIPLLMESDVEAAVYELIFYIGDYFRRKNPDLIEPLFLDKVPVRFGISDPAANYHVPLLASPWGYQVYRGS
ncbi:hydroxyisourate hydrolase [Oceanobacillus massiliensis]|uniref:hydroxyisourate hydrolase n=1 Tax=Oceanobacillus massiliensis TaxID=1465765 RepID=UPI00301A38D2